jgi:COP9 signalosome complex subunit 6
VINMSDHFTRQRVRAQSSADSATAVPTCIGALLGEHSGSHVEIHTSFEVVSLPVADSSTADDVSIDLEYLSMKKQQYAQIFPKYELIGWYTTSTQHPFSLRIYNSLIESTLVESPLCLVLDATFSVSNAQTQSNPLPVFVYEPEVHVGPTGVQVEFQARKYTVVSGDAERVGVDHVSSLRDPRAAGTATIVPALQRFRAAFIKLRERVTSVHDSLDAAISAHAQDPEAAQQWILANSALLRRASSLSDQLVHISSRMHTDDFWCAANNVLLETYCASMTHALAQADKLLAQAAQLAKQGSTTAGIEAFTGRPSRTREMRFDEESHMAMYD